MEAFSDLPLAEEPPLSFEDLPDDLIRVILRKLERFQDKIRLTQASPSARRLTRGPSREPDVFMETLRAKVLDRMSNPKKAAHINSQHDNELFMAFYPSHPDFPLALDYLAARSKAFSKVVIDGGSGNLETHICLLNALYSQGVCCPVSIHIFFGGRTSRLDLLKALVSHWLTVSEGIHSPKDRSVFAYYYDKSHFEFLNDLRGIGELKLQGSSYRPDRVPLPALPHLADCLEKLNVFYSDLRPDWGPCNLTALREVAFKTTSQGAGFTGPPGSLHRFFASCANSLEYLRLEIASDRDDTLSLSLEPFVLLPRLKHLLLGTNWLYELAVLPSEANVFLPSLEQLTLSAKTTGPNNMSVLLSNVSAPNLRVLEYEEAGHSSFDLRALFLPSRTFE